MVQEHELVADQLGVVSESKYFLLYVFLMIILSKKDMTQ
jgi:hypothetical protein